MPALRVESGQAELAAWVQGPEGAPVVLALHGYPDDHTVWDLVAERLAGRYRVATFDLRGFGESAGAGTDDFSYAALRGDVAAVADALGGRVHLVGHDWGSIIGWLTVTDPDAASRVATYTSISGVHPALYRDYLVHDATAGVRKLAGVARQLVRSSYSLVFQAPGLAEALVGLTTAGAWRRMLRASGVPAGDPMLDVDTTALRERMRAGLALYRNAARERVETPSHGSVTVPVQLILPDQDRFLGEAVRTHGIAEVTQTAYLRRIHTGHWPLRSHPDLVAAWVSELVESVETGETPPELARCRLSG